jgi:hypothetical protein
MSIITPTLCLLDNALVSETNGSKKLAIILISGTQNGVGETESHCSWPNSDSNISTVTHASRETGRKTGRSPENWHYSFLEI